MQSEQPKIKKKKIKKKKKQETHHSEESFFSLRDAKKTNERIE